MITLLAVASLLVNAILLAVLRKLSKDYAELRERYGNNLTTLIQAYDDFDEEVAYGKKARSQYEKALVNLAKAHDIKLRARGL